MSSSASTGGAPTGPAKLSDLPGLVARYGASRLLAKATARTKTVSKPGVKKSALVGSGQSGFNLVETDLTPNSPSDERQPAVSPSGALIAFISNGTATNGAMTGLNANGNFHLFVMNRNGSGVRQVTGLSTTLNGTSGDIMRSQSRPSWSPDGNQLVYIDGDPADPSSTQVWSVNALAPNSTPLQLTSFPGNKSAPAFAPSGLSIAFSTNVDARTATPATLAGRNIFSISPSGSRTTLTRLTGDPTNDPTGTNAVDDNPAWALVNTDVLFFSSNRDRAGLLTTGGRRIWKINSDGTKPAPITDPTQRSNGQVTDVDDFPALSLSGAFSNATVGEQVSFQTNSFLDTSDQTEGARGHDLNVWGLAVNTNRYRVVPTVTEKRLYVGRYGADGFDGDGISVINLDNPTPTNPSFLPSDFVPFIPLTQPSRDPEGLLLLNGDILVSDRGTNSVDRFKEIDGTPNPGVGVASGSYQFTRSLVPSPSGLITDGNYIYVAGGFGGTTTQTTTALYRFFAFNGAEAGSAGARGNAAFSSGETTDGKVTNGCENLLQGESIFSRVVFASVLVDNKINAYSLDTGKFLTDVTNPKDVNTFVSPALPDATGAANPQTTLSLPTGSAWGPDLNGDGFRDLYVCSSGADSIKVYAGPNTNGQENIDVDPFFPVGTPNAAGVRTLRPGTWIKDILPQENNGDRTGLNAPERILILDRDGDGQQEMYISSFRATGGNAAPGRQINRYAIDETTGVALSWPSGAAAPIAGSDTAKVNAGWVTNLFGPASFVFNSLGATTRPPTPPSTAIPNPVEGTSAFASVNTNILSSPTNASASQLTPPTGTDGVDRAADREPSFSRSTATSQTLAMLVFASGRRYLPVQGGALANPYGGDQDAPGVTHDIWSTSTQDTTPPALIPQGAGNLAYPVVAPQPNAPFPAPRTAEQGLKAGVAAGTPATQGGLRFAVVLRDTESGISPGGVSVSFFNANARSFETDIVTPIDNVINRTSNEGRKASVAYEGRPSPVAINGQTSFALTVYDDGAASAGGHEQQANAVKGDGNFYCEALLPTPATASDFYIDLSVTDRAGNSLLYDRVWGFSTQLFTRTNPDLFVSDYAGGQDFPGQIVSPNGDDRRFANQPPVESYFLSNPGGQDVETDTKTGQVTTTNATSISTSFSTVDTWRILCRGPVTSDLLNAYRPTVVPQLDPADPTGKFTQLTRKVTASKSAVIWAAPYAGTTFVGPGTIIDPATQDTLTGYLNTGGRLFLSGREVAWALTSGGTQGNKFLTGQMGANYSSDVNSLTTQITAGPGEFLDGGTGKNAMPLFAPFGGDFVNLQIPRRAPLLPPGDTFPDGALNLDPNGGEFGMDLLTATTPPNGTLVTAYTLKGSMVGDRVEQAQPNGLNSRAVFFSFGFEAINRRYRTPNGDPRIAVNSRYRVASYILSYFKTGSLSGTVINDANNTPINGFLLSVTGDTGTTYLARTDVNGNYSLEGLPFDRYTVKPFLAADGSTDPRGFFGGSTTGTTITLTFPDAKNINLRPIPLRPGTVSGKATSLNSTDPKATFPPIANLPVLILSKNPLMAPNPVGTFSRITTTDAAGNFSFSQVPSGEEMRVILNPTKADIPPGSNIPYYDSTDTGIPAGATVRNPNFGRREIPDTKRPVVIVAPQNDTFFVDDIAADTAANEGVSIFVPPPTTAAVLNGTVSVNGSQTAAVGATVELRTDTGLSLTPVRTTTVKTDGTYSFTDVPQGSFQVVATLGNLSGTSATVVVAKLATTVTVPDIALTATGGGGGGGNPTPTPTPVSPKGVGPTFAVGRSYAISVPYETSANANSRNLFDRSDADATISITDAFNYVPTEAAADGTTTRLYTVSRFDVNTLTYIPLADDGVLSRGEGYLLTVAALPQSALPLQLNTAVENAVLTPLTLDPNKNQFSVVLTANSSLSGNTLAGNNFIGFGFDPTQFSSVPWDTTTADPNASSVTVTSGTRTYSLAQAVGNAPVDRLGTRISLMGSSLTTINNAGTTSVAGPATSLTAFGGYFVVAKKDGLRLTFKNPSSSGTAGTVIPANTSFAFTMPFATTGDAAGTVPTKSAFTATSTGYTVYAFNAAGQKGARKTVTGGDFTDVTGGVLQRGMGYVVVTGSVPVTLNTAVPLVPFSGMTFSIPLTRNAALVKSSPGTSATNGYNLIGSPFDPFTTGNVSFTNARITATVGTRTYTAISLKEAAARGIISNRIFTLDSTGNLIAVPLNAQFLRPYQGYFVQIYKDNVTMTLTASAK